MVIEEQATRQRLLDAARQLFAEKGFGETSTREIAAAAGCNLSLINHYFASKEGLLRELVTAKLGAARDQLAYVVAKQGAFADKIEAWVDFVIGLISADVEITRIIQREVLFGGSLGEELRPMMQSMIGLFVGLIEQGKAAGALRADADPRYASLVLNGMIHFYFLAYPVSSKVIGPISPATLAELKRHILMVFLGGVTPPATPAGGAR